MPHSLEPGPLVGRHKELSRLARAVEARNPLLLHGPRDSGKTFLLRAFLHSLPAKALAAFIYVPRFDSMHMLLQAVARQIFVPGGTGPAARRIDASTSGRLRLLLRGTVRERRLCIFLDHAPRFSPALARLANEWIWRGESALYLLSRGSTRDEIGYAWSIYYSPEMRLAVGKLPEHAANELLDHSIRRFGLAAVDGPEFRSGVLRLSRGLPGAIVKMSSMAADSRYRYGRRVKLRLLHVDYLMQAAPAQVAARAGAA